jgi:integrase
MMLLALTFVRPCEPCHAEWFEFDLDAGVWEIPAEKMKMRRPHLALSPSEATAGARKCLQRSALPTLQLKRTPI